MWWKNNMSTSHHTWYLTVFYNYLCIQKHLLTNPRTYTYTHTHTHSSERTLYSFKIIHTYIQCIGYEYTLCNGTYNHVSMVHAHTVYVLYIQANHTVLSRKISMSAVARVPREAALSSMLPFITLLPPDRVASGGTRSLSVWTVSPVASRNWKENNHESYAIKEQLICDSVENM